MSYPEHILARKISEGDGEAFEEVFLRHYKKVSYYALQYLLDEEEAKNIAQETFLELWRKREAIDPSLNIVAYLLTIARNKSLNVLRNKTSRRKYAEYITGRRAEADYAALADSSAEKLIAEETYGRIESILARMPEKTRAAFLLSREEELSYAEIAARMGTTVKMVEYRIMQALRILRAHMGELLSIALVLLLGFL